MGFLKYLILFVNLSLSFQLLLALISLMFRLTNGRTDAVQKPSFVVFFVDDMGYGDLGCFGRENVSTPNIDRMAKEGLKLTQWISAAPVCTPSRAALHTSRLPVRYGLSANKLPYRVLPTLMSSGGIIKTELTLPQILKNNGYATGISGKWHLGFSSNQEKHEYLPLQKGYESWFGIPFSNMHFCKEEPKGDEGALFCVLMANNTIVQQPYNKVHMTDLLTRHAIDFITRSVKKKKTVFLLNEFSPRAYALIQLPKVSQR
uniref:Sulfatase N-terminal domain-containing protein n=1 Tax=Aplanochytrium stocchinoi TaxID=215587 RepID=A0A7S3PHR7_9STRA